MWTLIYRFLFVGWLAAMGLPNPYYSAPVQGGNPAYYTMPPWGTAIYFPTPWPPCLSTPYCDPQTGRWTLIESPPQGIIGDAMLDVRRTAGRTIYVEVWLYSDRPPANPVRVRAGVMQSFSAQSYRGYWCPEQQVSVAGWLAAGCSIRLPTVEGLYIPGQSGLGAFLDTEPFAGWLDVASMRVWLLN